MPAIAATISVLPRDTSLIVKLDSVYRADNTAIATTDFAKPVFVVNDTFANTNRVVSIGLTNNVLADNQEITIAGLINNRSYLVSYHQLGLGVSTPAESVATLPAPAIPHGKPATPIISRGETGAVANAGVDFNNFSLNINLNDKDQARPDDAEELVENVYIYYAREDTSKVVKTIKITGATDIHAIRTNGIFTFGDGLLKSGGRYNFQVQVENDTLMSDMSAGIEVEMSVLPTPITTLVSSIDATKPHQIKYVLTVPGAAKTNLDTYTIERENLNQLDHTKLNPAELGSPRVFVRTIASSEMSAIAGGVSIFTGFIDARAGELVRLVATPFSAKKIKGVEAVSNIEMAQELRTHMLEIGLETAGRAVRDGSGNVTVFFQGSHTRSEYGYESVSIDLSKLTNNRYDLFLASSPTVPLTGKLLVDSNGRASVSIFMKLKIGNNASAASEFTLDDATGYVGTWSDHHIQVKTNLAKNINLLAGDAVSKSFSFPVTPTVPPVPTLVVTATPDAIRVSWSSTPGIPGQPTTYRLGLVKNAGLDYQIGVTPATERLITNGAENAEFLGLARLDAGQVNQYSVYLIAINDAGSSAPVRSALVTLPTNELPTSYIESFSLTAGPMVVGDNINRTITGKITVNKSLWLGTLNRLVMRRENDFGVQMDTDINITNAELKQEGVSNVFTFDFPLPGKTDYNMSIKAETLAIAADAAKGITALAVKTSSKLYAYLDVSLPPRIASSTFAFDNTLKTTLYSIRIENGGSPVTAVSVTAIPSVEATMVVNAQPGTVAIVHPASKINNFTNGDELWKLLVPYKVSTFVEGGVTYAVDSISASTIHGTANFGSNMGDGEVTHFSTFIA
jgi:hypothetical protein